MSRSPHTLLEPGHEAEWRQLGAEKREHLSAQAARHLRAIASAGVIDLVRGGMPPLDFETVAAEASRY